jgi:CHRD domain
MKTKIWILLGTLLMVGSLFAGPITYAVTMSGPNESPANASPGTGFATIIIDSTANTLNILSDTFTGLTGTTTASHIHCCTLSPLTGTAGVATQVPTFANFPLGVTSGSYFMSFDMTQASTWNPAFVTASGGTPAGAEAALVAGALAGKAYLNIHSSTFPGGEIRGFLVPAPEPGTITLAIGALAGLILVSKLRRIKSA